MLIKNTLDIIKNIIKTKIYATVFLFVTLIVILFPLLIKEKFIPEYKEQIMLNIQDEAKKVANYLSTKVNYSNINVDEINENIKEELEVFSILKIKFFDKNGKTIYSTDKSEIGEQYTSAYFFNKVVKGESVYFIEYSESLSSNVIEMYIPIMKEGKFTSAFELYYNISEELYSFNKLASNTMKSTYLLVILGYLSFVIIIFSASKNNLNLKKKQEQLKKLAHRDSLTNLFNRRYFYDIAEKVLSLTQRNKEKLSIAVLDIDDFKLINDTYGHNAGDFVIKSFAANLKKLTRESDIISRFGGEEFIILLPKTDIEGALTLANKICNDISELELKYKTLNLSFTVSIGISEYKINQNIDDFINDADKALYQAKRTGKNKVEQF